MLLLAVWEIPTSLKLNNHILLWNFNPSPSPSPKAIPIWVINFGYLHMTMYLLYDLGKQINEDIAVRLGMITCL